MSSRAGEIDRRNLIFINDDNQFGLELLISQFAKKPKPVCFVGAGVSARSGYPTWSELIERLLAMIRGTKDEDVLFDENEIRYATDLLWKADACRKALALKKHPERYFQLLKEVFRWRREHNPLLENLIRLPFSQFVTTNFDPCIQAAFERRYKKAIAVIDAGLSSGSSTPALQKLSKLRDESACIHLHGIFSNPEGIILTESDYRARYFNRRLDGRRLARFLEQRVVVFFGFSLDDADFMNVLRIVSARLDGISRKKDIGPNFAFLPLSDSEPVQRVVAETQRLTQKYRIRPIFYRRLTQEYSGLDAAVVELVRRLDPGFRLGLGEIDLDVLPDGGASERRSRKKRPVLEGALGVRELEQPSDATRMADFVFNPARIRNPKYPDDPNKSAFGGLSRRNSRELTAKVTDDSDDWFTIELAVKSLDPKKPLKDAGKFYVHPSFPKGVYSGTLVNRMRIQREFWAYGAFTVGVLVDGGKTALELDLAELPDAPAIFRSR